VLSNAFPTGVPDGLTESLFDLAEHGKLTRDWIAAWKPIYESLVAAFALAGLPYETPPASPAPALPARAYAGVYANDYAGPVEISGDDTALELRMGPEPRSYALTHFERDTFTYLVDREPPAALTGATFVVGPDGQAQGLILEYFAGNGQQWFPRVAGG
jgi:hypothetical protein